MLWAEHAVFCRHVDSTDELISVRISAGVREIKNTDLKVGIIWEF